VVDVYINYLRRKLRDDTSIIQTVRGQGYRMAPAAILPHTPQAQA
jgi:DNA-binding response OmpR family regulator